MAKPIVLILGLTSTGKTARSVELAKAGGGTVISLDRVQCHRELAIGSGRPTETELAGTTRIYLDHPGSLAQGLASAERCVDVLERLLSEARLSGAEAPILEGGSISILRELATRPNWNQGIPFRIEQMSIPGPRQRERRIRDRVTRVLDDRGEASLFAELAAVWSDEAAKAVAYQITGYREIVDACERHQVDVRSVRGNGRLPAGLKADLIDSIVTAHLAYARQQEEAIAEVLPALRAQPGCA